MQTYVQTILFFFLTTLTTAVPVNNTTPLSPHGLTDRDLPSDLPSVVTLNIKNQLPGAPALQLLASWNIHTAAPIGNNGNEVGQFTDFASLSVPWGWAGAFIINKATSEPFNINGSRIEGNYGVQDPDKKVFIDVSYVVGYSVPIVCSCGDIPVTGCNIDLRSKNACPEPEQSNGDVCKNPKGDSGILDPFFAPCAGAAYTYFKDDSSTQGCPLGTSVVNCCIGTTCQPPPTQKGS